jgi:hypothetical protein
MERKATQHHDFVGETAAQEKMNTIGEMAAELEELAEKDAARAAASPFRIPHSIEEGKQVVREIPDALREKARERLSSLPGPAQWAVQVSQEAAGLLFAPLRIGLRVTRELLRVPAAMVHLLRHRDA